MSRIDEPPSGSDGPGRRAALRCLTAVVLAGATGGIGVSLGAEPARAAGLCVNLAALSAAERKQRTLDNYTERSRDPHETCSVCRFFTQPANGKHCGHCEIFNGPANPAGRCDDWTARPASAR